MKLVKSITIAIILQIIVVSILGVSVAVAQSPDVVYDDQLADQWSPEQWYQGNPPPFYTIDHFHNGQYVIEVNDSCDQGWGAFGLNRYTAEGTEYWMYPNQYQELTFYFNPGDSTDDLEEGLP